MKKVTILWLMVASLILSAAGYAAEGPVNLVSVLNPRMTTGIHIGDVLQREIHLQSKAPYQLSTTALPIKGERNQGVELVDVAVQTDKAGDDSRYVVTLSYQVFSAAKQPKVLRLPDTAFAFTGGKEAAAVNIPVWQFWFSPLVTGSIHTARDNIQPQMKPFLIETDTHQLRFGLALALMLAGLVGLVYVNADKRWLPFMGGEFSRAYRKLRKLPRTPGQEQQALQHVHQAFNQVYGRSLFRQNLEQFFAEHPEYRQMQDEIDAFFARSDTVLFTTQPVDAAKFIEDTQQFSRALRDCERRVA
ncbi:nonribosomal peptide synthetase MxaA [Methylobacillus gramineus]|uniref:nonribosomal peptide synthetase MxaA n=1 Tax=Methylobacillus gramineus TaxID=755169 RepID=UPI001CFFF388|nr:nonribosomal peptide synthetase MxaA [Methylobacillus gramineus]MCB5184979.1 nonribosomal peptide synthetase MxaA [Methylobacillus gramineus]